MNKAEAQTGDSLHHKTLPAGKEYAKSRFYQSLWGKHYRKEWTTPARFEIAMLDTVAGGLTPYEIGGGRETTTLKLKDKNGREYVLRSIDKNFSSIVPDIAKGSFVEKILDDQVSIAHPYAALTISPMAEAIGIYHTEPKIYYIPKQKGLGNFNDSIGNALYLFEQRPDENWATAPNFGNASDIIGTEKMLEKIHSDNDKHVDQLLLLRMRLFDIVIGDWGRHEDQWRWAEFKEGKTTIYRPIPRDRDQAYTKFDGFFTKRAIRSARLNLLQTFNYKIKNINGFNYPARNLDRHLLNELTLEQWKETAADIQRLLTDAVIDSAMKQLPPEVYPISGPEIAAKLKSRRNHLLNDAVKYYGILSMSVDVTGTTDRELFEVKRLNKDSTQVNIYKISNKGKLKEIPFYSRMFIKKETNEVRLYGLGGEDEYKILGDVNRSISIRLIGGTGKDVYIDSSYVFGPSHKTEIYDNPGNQFQKTSETSLHISADTAINEFKYNAYKFDKRGFKPAMFYSFEDRIFVTWKYLSTRNKWRKEPYGYTRYFDFKYSINQNAFSTSYKSRYTALLGKWDVIFYGNYDFIRWTNFYGLGNETKLIVRDRNFNRMRSANYMISTGVERLFGNYKKVSASIYYQGINIKYDEDRYLAKTTYNYLPGFYRNNGFAGINLNYVYQKLDDSILPRKGISFLTTAGYVNNLRDNHKSFGRLTAEADLFIPFTKKWGAALKVGGASIAGKPVFYQYNTIGGSETLRGYRRERYYGNHSLYTQTELQWISPVRSYIYNGRIGVFALYDVGRVWLHHENSNRWHNGYGAGIILCPYDLVAVSLSYAVSSENNNIHIQIIRPF